MPVRGTEDDALGGAGAAGQAFVLQAGNHVGEAPVAVLGGSTGVVQAVAHGEDDRADPDLLVGLLLVQVDCLCGADGLALAAVETVSALLNQVGIGNGAGRRFVDGLVRCEAGLETVWQIDRADLAAIAAVDARVDVHVSGFVDDGSGEVARLALQVDDFAERHHPNVGMHAVVKQCGGDGRAGAAVAVVGCSAAEHAVVGGKHESELGNDATEAGRRLDEIHLESSLRQVHGRAHATHACAYNEHSTNLLSVSHIASWV